VLKQPAYVDGGGHAVFRHAAALPLEVRGVAMPLLVLIKK
jgi:hypothetical protein